MNRKKKQKKTSTRSSRLELFCKKGILRNFEKFTGKHLPLFLIKLQASDKISKKFANFAKFLRRAFPTEHLRWLLL